MKATIKTFESGSGDCIFLFLENPEDGTSHSIMIDCNTFGIKIQEYIKKELKKRIDTLIVTHVDSDHVNGLTSMMRNKDFADLSIGKIYFNCFQPKSDQPVKLSEETIQELNDVAKLLPPIIDDDIHKTNGMDAACFVQQLELHPEWKKVWYKNTILAGDTIDLGEAWGKLVFLSPEQKDLDALKKELRIEFAAHLGIPAPKVDFEGQEKYYQLMAQVAGLRRKTVSPKKTGADVFTDEILERLSSFDSEDGVTIANKASLAFVWECRDKKILFMGDAVSSRVLPYLGKESEIRFEAIKISHHGSKYNTSIAFNEKVNTEHYFLTGGKKGEGPNIEAISKFILKPLCEDMETHFLHYNHTRNIDILNILMREDVKVILDKHLFKLSDTNEYTFEY